VSAAREAKIESKKRRWGNHFARGLALFWPFGNHLFPERQTAAG
jgi:hypothetical protein